MTDFPEAWTPRIVQDLIAANDLVIGDGYRAKNVELGGGGLPFARAGNINNGFRLDDADVLDGPGVLRAGHKVSRAGDVVFTSKGTVGRFAFVTDDVDDFVYSPQLCFWRSSAKGAIEARFLYYWMHGSECSRQFDAAKGQTDMADYVSLRDQKAMTVTLPGTAEQSRISAVLASLDAAIATELAVARNAFAVLELQFEHSLRDASVGADSLASIAEFFNGGAFTKDASGTGRPVLRIRELNADAVDGSTVRSDREVEPKHLATEGDLLFSWSGTLDTYRWYGEESIINQHIFKVVPTARDSWEVELWLNHHLKRFRRIAADKAVTMGHIRRGDLEEAEVLDFANDDRVLLDAIGPPIAARRDHARRETRRLSLIRDLLLPKLVSGAIRVPATTDDVEARETVVDAVQGDTQLVERVACRR